MKLPPSDHPSWAGVAEAHEFFQKKNRFLREIRRKEFLGQMYALELFYQESQEEADLEKE